MPPKRDPKPELEEQSWRLRAAMAWGRFGTPAEMAEHIEDTSGGAIQSRVFGHAPLKEGMRLLIAQACGIDPDYLRDGGPEPFPSPAAAQAEASGEGLVAPGVLPAANSPQSETPNPAKGGRRGGGKHGA